jgi:putative hydrolase of the HAD superfamily
MRVDELKVTSGIRALILDFGGVLTRDQPYHLVEEMARLAGLPIDDFQSRYWRHRGDYDGGLTGLEYWTRVLDGVDAPPDTIEQLIEVDAASWSDFRPDMWELAAAFRARGGRTAILSNGVPEIIARIRGRRHLETWFDAVVVSCEVGRCKPDPAIYRICLERLGCTAADALFVDDRLENVEAAAAEGLKTLHFTGDGSVRTLRELLLV